MPKPARPPRATPAAPPPPTPPASFAQRTPGRLLLVLMAVAMMALVYAPVGQFYLAWVGLAPWLILVARARSKRAVFFWSWLTGYLFFAANVWWMAAVTLPGMLALMLYMGVWFPLAGLTLWGSGVLRVPLFRRAPDGPRPDLENPPNPRAAWRLTGRIFLVAAVWVAAEWTWGNLMTGFPWLYTGHSQTPILAMCQVADFASVYGVSFWVALINALIAFAVLHRGHLRKLIVPAAAVAIVVAATLAYGLFRLGESTQYPGPTVLVVQPSIPQDPTGEKSWEYERIRAYHLRVTRTALQNLAPADRPDLVVWSETMLPAINPELRAAYAYAAGDPKRDPAEREKLRKALAYIDDVLADVAALTAEARITLAAGAHAIIPASGFLFNSVLVFTPGGQVLPQRYDKMHLVPFGEFMPFRNSIPPLYRFFKAFDPNTGDYEATPGESLTAFPLAGRGGESWRFVSPICFDDVDSRLMARLFRGDDGGKRADFAVNATNDGWFLPAQLHQHIQLASFRCIENRIPTARSVNTGISGFIDSTGRTHGLLPARVEGTSVARLNLDRRVTFYTRHGDLFAGACVLTAAGLLGLALWNGMKNRRSGRR